MSTMQGAGLTIQITTKHHGIIVHRTESQTGMSGTKQRYLLLTQGSRKMHRTAVIGEYEVTCANDPDQFCQPKMATRQHGLLRAPVG